MIHETPVKIALNRKLFFVGIIVVLSFIVFSNTFDNEFHLDDANSIVGNPGIRKIFPLGRFFTDVSVLTTYTPNRQFRPFLPLSLSINYAIGKYDPVSYHLFNLFFNTLSAILLFFIFIELQKQSFPSGDRVRQMNIAFASSVLFAVHPVSGITVNYISNRDLVMMQMFLLASFLAYISMRRKGESAAGYAFVSVLLLFSILSKTNPVVMPFLVIAYEVLVMKRKLTESRTWLRAAPFALVVILFFSYTNFFLKFSDIGHLVPNDKEAFLQYFPTQVKQHLFVYFYNFINPFNIYFEPHVERVSMRDPSALLGILFIAGTLFAAIKLKDKNPLLSFCIAAYWIMISPESSFVPFHEWRVDYRPYPSSPYLYFFLVTAASHCLSERFFKALFFVFLLYFSVSSFFINKIWRTGYSLWSYSYKKGANPIAIQNLALTCTDLQESKEYLEKAMAISPYYILPNINYGITLIRIGAEKKGIDTMKNAVAIAPYDPTTHYWLAQAYEMTGKKKEAYEAAKTAAKLDPASLQFLHYAAVLAQTQGEYDASLRYTEQILKNNPEYEDTYFVHGFGLQRTGKLDECITAYRSFLAANREHFQAWFNLAFALKDKGLYADAAECFNRTLDLKPDYDEARRNLAYCYSKTGSGNEEVFERLVLQNK